MEIPTTYTEKVLQSNEIISLKDNSTYKGSFFLGSGSIKNEPMFFYYKKVGKGFKLESIPTRKAIIIYSIESPKVEQIKYISNSKWSINPRIRYNIYIPSGTIKTNFILDSE